MRQAPANSSSTLGNAGPVLPSKLGWVGPAFLLLGALFLQSAGLYAATGSYVQWVESLDENVSLDDPLAKRFQGLGLLDALKFPLLAETWIDAVRSLLAIVWLCWVARTQDLTLWTRSLFSGAALALFKGLMAWAIVLPDPGGWEGCRTRLGKDGLEYFREVAGEGVQGHISKTQMLFDVLLLEMRGLWILDRPGHQRTCGDTAFSSPVCFSTLLVVGLYEAIQSWAESLKAPRRLAVRVAVGVVLSLVLLADLVLAVLRPRHYTLDVVLALPLTLLVYSNPAVAIATHYWVGDWAQFGLLEARLEDTASPLDGGQPSSGEPELEASPQDVGRAVLPPCCFPFCSFAGTYFLRADPGEAGLQPWTVEAERLHREQLEEVRVQCQRETTRKEEIEGNIEKMVRRSCEYKDQLAAKFAQRLEAELRLLREKESKSLNAHQLQLKAVEDRRVKLKSRIDSEKRRFSLSEAEYKGRSARLSHKAKQLQRESQQARSACVEHDQSIKECEQEMEQLQKVLFRDADPAGEACPELSEEPEEGNSAKEACQRPSEELGE